MYPNLPHELIFEALKKNWKYLRDHIPLTRNEFIGGIQLLLRSNYFQFNNKFDRQIKGTAIGYSISPILANMLC